MKTFLYKVLLFAIGVIAFSILYVLSFSSGYFDFYYKRISSPKQGSLIIGVSRSAQGIVPRVMDSVISEEYFCLYNFSFAANYSPYGRVYYNAIRSKLDTTAKDRKGIFIVTVDPRSISIPLTSTENDTLFLVDNTSFLNNLSCFSCEPNLDYILYGHETIYKKVFLNMIRGQGYLHDDGWLEITIPNDSLSRLKRLETKLADNQYERDYKFSRYRFNYLKRTIEYLSDYGEVYLVRLPVHPLVLERQKETMPEFKEYIDVLLMEYVLHYLDYSTSGEYYFTDGSHLTAESAKLFSANLARDINYLE